MDRRNTYAYIRLDVDVSLPAWFAADFKGHLFCFCMVHAFYNHPRINPREMVLGMDNQLRIWRPKPTYRLDEAAMLWLMRPPCSKEGTI